LLQEGGEVSSRYIFWMLALSASTLTCNSGSTREIVAFAVIVESRDGGINAMVA